MPLSNEDKIWIAELLKASKDETVIEVKQHASAAETKLRLEIKASKDETVIELKQHVTATETKLRLEMATAKDDTVNELKQHVEEVETRLLRAFRNFSHPVEARLRVQKITSRATNDRIDALEDRIEFLEEGGTKPPSTYTPESR